MLKRWRRALSMVAAMGIILSGGMAAGPHGIPGSAIAEQAASTTKTLRIGDRGDAVIAMKTRLQELRYIGEGPLSRQYTEKTAEAVREFQQENGLEETGEADERTMERLNSGEARAKPYPTMPPLAAPEMKSEPDYPPRDADGFLLSGEIGNAKNIESPNESALVKNEFFYENDKEGRWIYLSEKLQIEVNRYEDRSIPLVWFETDIRTSGGEAFRTAMTDEKHPGKKYQYPYVISRNEKFVLGFSDDFYANRMADGDTVGIIIRNGEMISRDTYTKSGHKLPNLDMMAQYADGRLAVYHCNEKTAQELQSEGAVNVFSFGPMLLRDGEINELVYKYYRSIEPRQALGMIEPGHYLLLSVEGRTKESRGTMLQRVAEMMREKGVQEALNLDGGNTMALVFRGRMLNKLATYKKRTFVRTVTSLIGIGYTDQQEE